MNCRNDNLQKNPVLIPEMLKEDKEAGVHSICFDFLLWFEAFRLIYFYKAINGQNGSKLHEDRKRCWMGGGELDNF